MAVPVCFNLSRLPASGLLLALLLLAGPLGGARLAADEDAATGRYFEALRARRLFSLAEGYALRRLEDERLTDDERAQIVLELSRTLAEHARFTTGAEADDLWRRAADVAGDYVATHARSAQGATLAAQEAFVHATRAQSLGQSAELMPLDPNLTKAALEALDDASTRLATVATTLEEPDPAGDALSRAQRRALLEHIAVRQGILELDRARLLEERSPARMETILKAQQILEKVGRVRDERLDWTIRLRLAECARLRGDMSRAEGMLNGLETRQPQGTERDELLAERMQLELDRSRPDDAIQYIIREREERDSLPGELRYLAVRALLDLRDQAALHRNTETASDLLSQAETQVRLGELQVGGYWSQRARRLWEEANATREFGPELTEQMQRAQTLYLAGNQDEAAREYEAAAVAAIALGRIDKAAELRFTAASILLAAGKFEEAAVSLRSLTIDFPLDERVAEADLMYAYTRGRQYERDRTEQRRLEYVQALEAHRRNFPDKPTAAEAAWMQGQLEERRQQVTRALELYQQIPADHARATDAHVAIARCYEAILDRLRELGRSTSEWEQAAIIELERYVRRLPSPPEPWLPGQAELVVRLARIRLRQDAPAYAAVDRMLEQVLAAAGDPATADDDTWSGILATTRQLRIVSLAGQGRGPEAQQQLEALGQTTPAGMLDLLDGLAQLARGGATGRTIGELQLQAALGLAGRRDSLSEADRTRLDLCLARAYAATDQPRKAIETYERLIQDQPRDASLRRTAAELLMRLDERNAYQQAQTHWRLLETLEAGGSERWLEARLANATCSQKLGRIDECRKLLAVTKILYPALGGDELKSRFLELERSLD